MLLYILVLEIIFFLCPVSMFVHTFLVTCALEFLVSADNSWSIGDTRVIKPNEQENVLSDYHGIVQVYTGMSTLYNLAMYRLHNKWV